MRNRNADRTAIALVTFENLKRGCALTARIVILSGIFALLTTPLAVHGYGATAQASTTLGLRIEPQASMTITPIASGGQPDSGGIIRLVKVELVIRLNRGTTASLRLQSVPGLNEQEEGITLTPNYFFGTLDAPIQRLTPGNPSQIIFTARQNGRYYLKIGVRFPESSNTNAAIGENVRLELRSSDQVLHLAETVRFQRN